MKKPTTSGSGDVGKLIVHAWTDGACSGNPGPGGWGVVAQRQDRSIKNFKRFVGGTPSTTNNRMELMAILVSIMKFSDHKVVIHTDSQYSIDCVTKWSSGWSKKGWPDSVKNADIIRAIYRLYCFCDVSFVKVKAHSGILLNEQADSLARSGVGRRDDIQTIIKNSYSIVLR